MASAVYGRPVLGRVVFGRSYSSSSTNVTITATVYAFAGELGADLASTGVTITSTVYAAAGTLGSDAATAGVTIASTVLSGSGTLSTATVSFATTVDIDLTATVLASPGLLGFPDAQPASALRERDARAAARDILAASGLFDGVYLGSLPERRGRSAGDALAATIQPQATRSADRVDADPTGRVDLSATMLVTVICREEDEEIRDSEAERLAMVACNLLNGSNLGGLALPQFTIVSGWNWLDANPPERRIRLTLNFKYLVKGWNNFSATA